MEIRSSRRIVTEPASRAWAHTTLKDPEVGVICDYANHPIVQPEQLPKHFLWWLSTEDQTLCALWMDCIAIWLLLCALSDRSRSRVHCRVITLQSTL